MHDLDTSYNEGKEVFDKEKLEAAIVDTVLLLSTMPMCSVDEYSKLLEEDLCQQQ